MKSYLPVPLLAVLALCGCKSYKADPVDWDEARAIGNTNKVHLASPGDAATVALIGNRRINALRLKAASSAAVAEEYGWWEDPELDFDIMRIVNPSDHPFLGGGSLAFTIPLSGAEKAAEKAARHFAAAEKAEVENAELNLSVKAKKAAIRLAALKKRREILTRHNSDERVVRARKNIEILHDAGEISVSERAGVRRTTHARRHDLMDTTRDIAIAEIELLKIMGLRPGTQIEIAFALPAPPKNAPPAIDVKDLTSHPEVTAALIRHNASEAKLEEEIRRQYPELKLGPAYANEEGLDRLGIVAGITLPLWNRNRKNIAEAEAARKASRLEAIDVWLNLVSEAAAAQTNLARLLAHPPIPDTELAEADALADAGELTPLEYLAVREEILDQKISECNWLKESALALAELEKFKQGAGK